MRNLSRFFSKTSVKYFVFIGIVLCVSLIVGFFLPRLGVVIILAFSAIMWLVVQVWLIDVKKSLESFRSSTTGNLIELNSRHAEIRDQQEIADTRLRKNMRITSDIAGSTGRSAPIIREIRSLMDSRGKTSGEVEQLKPQGKADVSKKSAIISSSIPQEKTGQNFPSLKGISKQKFNDSRTGKFKNIQTLDHIVPDGRMVRKRKINAMVIADEFTAAAFAQEWNQFLPGPENWQEILDQNKIDLLLVESAWEANGGSWRYHLWGQSAPRPAVIELVAACRKKGIPTAFWNKEDPPHFEEFLPTARLFDFVFTTEVALVGEYRRRLGHDNVAVLPFAAQPYYHNPARVGDIRRDGNSVFGGMYFRDKFPERRQQMDYLLPAASEFGLDIFSRNTTEKKYQFPEPLDRSVVGSLSYPQMIAAYHAYKVVLNVNSVPSSDSMCARRIFEATACGAAVVSPFSPSIGNYFPAGSVATVREAEEARDVVRALIRSEEYRDRSVHLAQRAIWQEHTYRHRVASLIEKLGVPDDENDITVSVFISTNRPASIRSIRDNLSRQQGSEFELVLITHGFDLASEDVLSLRDVPQVKNLKVETADVSCRLGDNLNRLVAMSSGDFLVRMDDDDWYGPNYIQDLFFAAQYSGADLVGKAATYIYFEELDSTVFTFKTFEHRYTSFIRGATFAGPRETFERHPFPSLGRSEDSGMLESIVKNGGLIYSADRFNFVVNRFSDKMNHTWRVDDRKLFATGEMQFVGPAYSQLDI